MMGKINIPQDDCLTGYGTITYNGVRGHYYRMPWNSTTDRQRRSWERAGCLIVRIGHAYAPKIQTCSLFVPEYLQRKVVRDA